MDKVLIGNRYPKIFIEKLNKEDIAHERALSVAPGTEAEKLDELKKIYNTEDIRQIGQPIYMMCETKDKQTIQDLYGEFIKEYPYGCEPPISEREKEYLNACHERYLNEFEERYGYRPQSKEWTAEELDALN